jgi:hypothetical protein
MSGYDIDRTLAEWFEADALDPGAGQIVDQVLDGVRQRRPRPAWLAGPGSHWGGMDGAVGAGARVVPQWRSAWLTALVLVILLGAVVVVTLVAGARLAGPAPLPPAPHDRLAYAIDGDVFVAADDGRNPVRIADGLPGGRSGCGSAGYWAEGPMWSPDGRYLAYRSPRDQVNCERPEADTVPTVILSDPAGTVLAAVHGVGWRVAWSPDSTRFATWLDLYPMTQIGVYGLDGVRQAVVSLPTGMEPPGDYDPIWSPDGESLLTPLSSTLGDGATDTWELPLDGRPARPLPAVDPRSHWMSARSPDGRQIAFVEDGKLVVAGVDGSQPRELASDVSDGWWYEPVWSPSGDRVAVATGAEEMPSELRVIDVATASVSTPVPAGVDPMRILEFSPDGDRILFSTSGRDGRPSALWSMAADGSDLQQLVMATNEGSIANGDWQPVPVDAGRIVTPAPASSAEGP